MRVARSNLRAEVGNLPCPLPTSARRLLRATRRALRALLRVRWCGSIFSKSALFRGGGLGCAG